MSETESTEPTSKAGRLYERLVLRGPMPALIFFGVLALGAALCFWIKDFQMDASTDSILLEDDKDLQYFNLSRELFGTDDFVVVVVSAPSRDALFSDRGLKLVGELGAAYRAVPNVESVMSILEAPLFFSPPVPMIQALQGKFKTLGGEGADRELAKTELTENAYCRDYLINRDGATTLLQVNFDADREYIHLTAERQALSLKKSQAGLSAEESARLREVVRAYDKRHAELSAARRADIRKLREITERFEKEYAEFGEIHIGGIPLVIADMINFIEHDLWVFGLAAAVFMALILAFIFRRLRWVALPMAACLLTVLILLGWMSLVHWRTTLVTSNFSSLLLILTLSTAIHIISRYREMQAEHPALDNLQLVSLTVRQVAEPCFFMIITTVVGFASLILSGIRPVMDFGMLMTIGLCLSFFMCFVFLPAGIVLFPARGGLMPHEEDQSDAHVMRLALFTARHPALIAVISAVMFGFLLEGASRLDVNARLVDYFKKSSEITRGMTVIDERAGGTSPLEIVLDGDGPNYWVEPENLKKLKAIHEYVDGLPETAKVLSAETLREIFSKVAKGVEIKKEMLLSARKAMPANIASYLVTPFLTPDYSKARIAVRVKETDKAVDRDGLRAKITEYLNTKTDFKVGERAHITGYFILYNNMTNSLYRSQIRTVATVFLSCLIAFWIIFRSLRLAIIGLVPNVLATVLILGTMGWMGIHLDIMTIMIAAVTFGLADDNTIHYIHRFRHEFPKDRNYLAAMYRCHNSIGRPMSYTMVTTVFGFALLMLSNFVPTVYFGFFTALAMFVALVAANTLLPMLIILVKPFGKGEGPTADKV